MHSHWTHTVQAGIKYDFNNKNTLTVKGLYRHVPGYDEHNTDYYSFTPDSQLVNHYRRETEVDEKEGNTDVSVNYERKFDKEEQKLTADIQYNQGFEEETEEIRQKEYDLNGNPTGVVPVKENFTGQENQQEMLLQADYVHPFEGKSKLEVGYKSIIENIKKDFDVERYNSGTESWEHLSRFSDVFDYKEGVHAGYAMYSDKFDKFSYQLGLRGEYSRVRTALQANDDVTNRSYFDLFPTIHLSQKLWQTHKFQLSYSRRINRPSLFSLNPIFSFSDNLNIWAGNPKLQPEYTHSLELGYLKYFDFGNISASLYYRHTNNAIVRLTEIDSEGVAITRPYNLATEKSGGIEFTYAFEPFDWWKLNGSFNYYRSIIDGKNISSDYTADFYTWSGRVNSQFPITDNLQLQAMFNYRAPQETPQGRRLARYFMDASIKKSLLQQRFTVSARVQDIFNTRQYESKSVINNTQLYSIYKRSFRTYYLKLTYKLHPQHGGHQKEHHHHHGR